MLEKTIEHKLAVTVKKHGGIAVKFVSPNYDGMPDRLVLLPDGVCAFVEVKAPNDEMKKNLVLEIADGEITASNAASLSNKLCQMANGAIYDDKQNIIEIHSRKLDALEDIIESMNGKPLLVAYWYKHDFERIAKRLDSLHISFSKLDTDTSIERWNKGEIPVALIHPASAGHGLNLQSGGSTLVWFGLTWSLELYQQTNARLYRQGQKSTGLFLCLKGENNATQTEKTLCLPRLS